MQETSGQALVGELETLFSLLTRTGSGLAAEFALTSTQRLVLIELVSSGALRLGALAERIGANDPTVSRAIDGLVAAEIVERRPDPDDRRAVLHVATPKGREWVERRRSEVAAALDDALARLSPRDRARALPLIARLNEELRAAGDEHSARYAPLLASR